MFSVLFFLQDLFYNSFPVRLAAFGCFLLPFVVTVSLGLVSIFNLEFKHYNYDSALLARGFTFVCFVWPCAMLRTPPHVSPVLL